MLHVIAVIETKPGQRDAVLAAAREKVPNVRAEQGCIEYVIAADPVEPGRAVLFERWASQADLDAHLAGLSSAPKSDGPHVAPTALSIVAYDVSGERTMA